MSQKYLLDTNAYFNFLRAVQAEKSGDTQYTDIIKKIKEGNPCVSIITKVEIISVLGKYARGNNGGFQQCNCTISEDGQRCSNMRYEKPRKRWKTKRIKEWKKLIEETMEGESKLLSLEVLPFDIDTIKDAQKVVEYALTFSFASMDAMIAATARKEMTKKNDIIVITSDKGLKACLKQCKIPIWDAFENFGK